MASERMIILIRIFELNVAPKFCDAWLQLVQAPQERPRVAKRVARSTREAHNKASKVIHDIVEIKAKNLEPSYLNYVCATIRFQIDSFVVFDFFCNLTTGSAAWGFSRWNFLLIPIISYYFLLIPINAVLYFFPQCVQLFYNFQLLYISTILPILAILCSIIL